KENKDGRESDEEERDDITGHVQTLRSALTMRRCIALRPGKKPARTPVKSATKRPLINISGERTMPGSKPFNFLARKGTNTVASNMPSMPPIKATTSASARTKKRTMRSE